MVLGVAVVALAAWVLSSHTDELSGLGGVLRRLNWWWLTASVGAELLSFVSFAAMQFGLLGFGGLRAPAGSLLKTTFAAQALANSFPGGNAVSAVYSFRWYRRFGAGNTLATWAIAGTVIASIVSLALVAALGLGLAAEQGASLDLVPAIVGVLVITVAIGTLFVYERPLLWTTDKLIGWCRALTGRPSPTTEARINKSFRWTSSVHLEWRQVLSTVVLGTGNWLFDCACFAMMFPAIGAPVPWKGLLLAYGAGQLATSLPITPGGLGVVEGSITIALVAFGGAESTTVDAVLIYRFISFWLVLFVGWALWGELALEVRHGRWSRQALATPVEAVDPATTADKRPSPAPDPPEVTPS
jgi:putative heme transporter